MRQALIEEHRTVRTAIVVLRLPDLTIRAFDREGLVRQPTGQCVLARFLQCGQINSRLDQRADRPYSIQRPVEPGKTGLATADHGLHFPGLRVGHDHCRFDVIGTLAPRQTLEGVVDRGFSLHLQDRVETGEDAQAFFGQVFVAIVFAQLTLDQIEEAGERAVRQTAALGHAQRHFLRRLNLLGGRDALLLQHIEYQVAPLEGTLRITTGVIGRRPLDHAHQQRDLMQLELGQRLAEEELAGQTETVHRTLTVLPDKHFVEVSLKDFALVVVKFKQQRHHRFGEFAAQAALVGQVEVLDQLLRQGTAALTHAPGRTVDPDCTGDRLRRNTKVMIKIAILDRHQRFKQVRWHLIDLDQNPVFEVFRVQAADQQRLQAHHRQLRAFSPRQLGHVIAGETHPHRLRLLHAFIELEATGIQINGIAVDRRRPRTVGHAFTAIAQGIELGQEIIPAQLLSDEQLERARVNLGRDGPALAGELLLDDCIKVNGESGQHHKGDQTEFNGPAQPRAQAPGGWFFRGTGSSSTSHGGGLYALYSSSTGALRGLRQADLRP
ncbi:hypothetical protein D3C75_324940 [compost metagenome]